MNRRQFLAQSASVVAAAMSQSKFAGALQSISSAPEMRVTLDSTKTLAVIPPDFMGLGYEISSVARPGLLSAQNAVYVQLVRTLGTQGVIRVGGNTSDYSSYVENGQPLSSPEGKAGSIVNQAVLRDLGTFLDATGWTLIWGLNLGNGSLENAIEEAKAVTAATKKHLLGFEIGNEPDLFPHRGGHRQRGYGYDDYLREYRAWRDALRKAIPDMVFAGPDAAVITDWVTRFASDEGKDIKLLTHHYYREGENPTSTIDKLLRTDPKLAPTLATLRAATEHSGVPYRVCETNSFSGGGRPGVSDTLAAALWVLDFMFTLASAGCAGVNMETGVNQRGFISSYSPIGDDEQGHYWAAPEYYGMLAFAQPGAGRIVGSTIDAGDKNIKVYATEPDPNHMVLTLINKEPSYDAAIVIDPGAHKSLRKGSLVRLSGPSLESKSGVTLGGASVSPAGSWKPAQTEEVAGSRGRFPVRVPAASAAVVTLRS
ncbi:MAG: glycosyl hydrolase family 79 C-terminal domain-containing protein [Terriglobales bacterium]